MTDFTSIFDRTDANIGTFTVTGGNVTKGSNPLITWFNDKAVIIAMNARSTFTLPAEHAMFDGIIMALSAKSIGIMYVDSVSTFMNPDARFKEFLKGDIDPATYGMTLTADEAKLPSIYAAVQAKFKDMFTLPTPPMSPGVDLTEFFSAEQIARIEEWRANKPAASLTGITSTIDTHTQAKAGLLRIVISGNSGRIENDRGHWISKTRFMDAYRAYIKPRWDKTAPDGEIGQLNGRYDLVEVRQKGYNYNDSKGIAVYNSYVALGCQSIPRAEIEAMVDKINAMTPSK